MSNVGNDPDSRQEKVSEESASTHPWGTQPEMFGPRHEYRLSLILRETARFPRSTRVLDGAVGLGQLAAGMVGQGHRVIGIDASFDAALFAKRFAGVPTVAGSMTALPFRNVQFGAVTSGETFEHLEDDAAASRELSRVLAPGGTCVVTVPALEILWTQSDVYCEHLRRYSRSGLRSLFENVGLGVEKIHYWGFPVVLIYDTLFLVPMNKRRARREVAIDPALRSVAAAGRMKWLVGAMKLMFSVDRMFTRIPFGPALLLVAIKPVDGQAARSVP